MKSLLLTATALALVTVASGAASAAGTQTNGRFATELNGAIANGIKSAPGDAVKNRNIVVEANGANGGAATGGQTGNGKTIQINPRLLVAAPTTGTASGGVAPNNTNTTVAGGNTNQNNGGKNQQFFIATPAQGTASGGVAPVRVAGVGTNTGTTSTGQGGKNQQQAEFFIATPGQGTASGGAAPVNASGNNVGTNNGRGNQPIQVGLNQPQGNFGGQGQFNGQQGAGGFQGAGFGQDNDAGPVSGGQFAGQSGGNFSQGNAVQNVSPATNFNQASNVGQAGQAQFIPAVGNGSTVAASQTFPQNQVSPSFNAGSQGGLTPVADGADLYRRMVAQGYWAVSVLDANSSVFQVLAVDAQHPGYAFLLAVDINWGRILTVRAIALNHGGSNTNYGHSVPTYQASAPTQTYGASSGYGYAGSYGNSYQSSPNYGGYGNGGYGQVAYGSRY